MLNSKSSLYLSLLAGLTLVSPAAFAQERTWSIHAGPSFSTPFWGGEDTRTGFTIGVQTSMPDPRVTFRGMKGDFVLEGYYLRTRGLEIDEHPSEFASAFGVNAIARYWFGEHTWFVDAGFGLQIQDKTSVDLDTYLNTTPTLGAGYVFKTGGTEWQLLVRFLHISNGGTNKPNQGQNHMQLLIGARF